MRRDGKVVPKGGTGTSGGVEFVVKGLHRSMQAVVVIVKMGEIVRPCHGCWHSRHDDFCVRVVGCFVCSATYRALSRTFGLARFGGGLRKRYFVRETLSAELNCFVVFDIL